MKKSGKIARGIVATALAAMTCAALAVPAFAADVTAKFKDVKAGSWYASNVQWAYDNGYITGYTDGSGEWGVGDPVTRAQLAAMLARHAGVDTSAKTDTTGISDLKKGGQWYTGAVNWAVSEGVITGYTDKNGKVTAFGPNDELSREQAATILARYAAKSGVDTSASLSVLNVFPDKGKIASWADDSVAWIVSEGVMSGYSGGTYKGWFGPADDVLREQMAKMLQGTVAIIEDEEAAGSGAGGGSGGNSEGTDEDEGEGGFENPSIEPGGSASGGDAGNGGDTVDTEPLDSSGSPYDFSSSRYIVGWTGGGVVWEDYAGAGKIVYNPFYKSVTDPLSWGQFQPYAYDANGNKLPGSMIGVISEEKVSYDASSRTWRVIYTPTESGKRLGYHGTLDFTSPAVPYLSRVYCQAVTCSNLACNHMLQDAHGNHYVTYLTDDKQTHAIDFNPSNTASGTKYTAAAYVEDHGNNPSTYGELDAFVEGRTMESVAAEAYAAWGESMDFFAMESAPYEDCILIAPWKLVDIELYCPSCDAPREGYIHPIHSRSQPLWSLGH